MTNSDLIQRFYKAFADAAAEEMVSCYHPEIIFRDPAFGELKGENAKDMWRMLVNSSKGELKITLGKVEEGADSGSAQWRAEYVFAPTGRKIINYISADFEFREGKIIRHTDHFDLWKWSRQALGWKGLFFGWTPFMRNQIQQRTNGLLKKWQTKNPKK
jgi:ketosteroid isomerase-like protein